MIESVSGNILCADAEALVNTVNCVGVMGRGIALQFKNAFPDNFKVYAAACQRHEVRPGRMFIYATQQATNPRYIVNFPTKRHWNGNSRIEDIETGLQDLAAFIHQQQIKSIAIPPLGCGLGGLDWAVVKSRIEIALQNCIDTHIFIYEPQGAPTADKMVHNRTIPKMTAGRAVLVGLMQRYLNGLLDPFISLLEVHKLMYFMQEAGEPLRLKYSKAPYGPYAENLRHVLHAIEGYLILGYADGGDAPNKQLHLAAGATQKASNFLTQYPDTLARFDKVADLVAGFESPFGLELLSTVHWLMKHESVQNITEIISHTHAWSSHKQKFTPRQITLAVDVLVDKNWT